MYEREMFETDCLDIRHRYENRGRAVRTSFPPTYIGQVYRLLGESRTNFTASTVHNAFAFANSRPS